MTIYCPGWRSSKEEEEEKEKRKKDFSSLSFNAATVAFGLALTQQSTRGGAAIQTNLLFGSALGKQTDKEEKE